MHIKVKGGTARGDEDLCDTCRNALIRRSENKRSVYCTIFSSLWKDRTTECTSYDDKRQPRLYEMKEIAWQVTGKGHNKAGFRPTLKETLERVSDEIEDGGKPCSPDDD